MTASQIILTILASIAMTFLMVVIMRRNARRAIAKREKENIKILRNGWYVSNSGTVKNTHDDHT